MSATPTSKFSSSAYDLGALALLQRHRRGRRKLQLPAPHRARQLHPDALREARRGGGPAVLPRADGASRRARHTLPAAGQGPRRQGASAGSRAGPPRSSRSWRGSGCAGRRRIIAPRSARRWPRCTRPGATFRSAAPTRSRSTAGARCSRCRATRADTVEPGLAAFVAAELDVPRARLADGSAGGRHPRRPLPRQRVLPEGQALRADRLLFRLQRPLRLRPRGLPERLVLRGRQFLQRHARAGADPGL